MSASISVFDASDTGQAQLQASVRIEAIVIGASAGGVKALIPLLQALPADFAPAVLIVLHLPPEPPSLLPQLFARYCKLPLKEAEDKESICPGSVYLAPANYHLLVEPEKTLALSVDEPEHYSRPSIDVLFESAAYAYGQRLLSIVLTGASIDGTRGVMGVRQLGGKVWIQDPDEAEARMMPASALAKAGADRVLSIYDMAEQLHASTEFRKKGNDVGDE